MLVTLAGTQDPGPQHHWETVTLWLQGTVMSQKFTDSGGFSSPFHFGTFISALQFSHLNIFHLQYHAGTCEEDAGTLVKCELTIDNSEAV